LLGDSKRNKMSDEAVNVAPLSVTRRLPPVDVVKATRGAEMSAAAEGHGTEHCISLLL
jgi:hypothetical protein